MKLAGIRDRIDKNKNTLIGLIAGLVLILIAIAYLLRPVVYFQAESTGTDDVYIGEVRVSVPYIIIRNTGGVIAFNVKITYTAKNNLILTEFVSYSIGPGEGFKLYTSRISGNSIKITWDGGQQTVRISGIRI